MQTRVIVIRVIVIGNFFGLTKQTNSKNFQTLSTFNY